MQLKLAQTEGRHDKVPQYIHWQLWGKCGLERASNWYEQKPEEVVESENSKIPDIVFFDKKEREDVIIDVAIPGDAGQGER